MYAELSNVIHYGRMRLPGAPKSINIYFAFFAGAVLGVLLSMLLKRVTTPSFLLHEYDYTTLRILSAKLDKVEQIHKPAHSKFQESTAVPSHRKKAAKLHTDDDTPAPNAGQINLRRVNEIEKHQDNHTLAESLHQKPKVLCWVMTSPTTIAQKGRAVMDTWGKRCDKLLFASDHMTPDFPTMNISVSHGRQHLTTKTMMAFDYVTRYIGDYDWFMKADDDTYVIMENLRYLLSSFSPDKKIAFGNHFKPYVAQGYLSGGGGYILSRAALKAISKRKAGQCEEDGAVEDVSLGRCLEAIGVQIGDSRDSLGRRRFHCLHPSDFINGDAPQWFYEYSKYSGTRKNGVASLSDYSISFHYINPKEMHLFEYFVYHLRPYGISNSPQDLNVPRHAREDT